MQKELLVAREACQAASRVICKYYEQGTEIRHKDKFNLVSDADIQAEEAIVSCIRDSFPDHSFLGEETHKADLASTNLWVIDPLDGTNNFAHHVPHFAVSIAYYREGICQVGAVLNPISGELFSAVRGKGAFLNDRPIAVSATEHLSEALIGAGFYYDRGRTMEATLDGIRDLFFQNIHGIRRFGAAALDLCYVAAGRFEAFFEFTLQVWDFAAGALIVEEAGGRVTTVEETACGLNQSSILASNGLLHPHVSAILIPHFAPLQK